MHLVAVMTSTALFLIAGLATFGAQAVWAQNPTQAQSQSQAHSQDKAASLYERRLGMIHGSAPGIEIIPARKAQPAESAASGVPASLPRWLQPPSGRALNDARRLQAPDQGVALPNSDTGVPSRRAAR